MAGVIRLQTDEHILLYQYIGNINTYPFSTSFGRGDTLALVLEECYRALESLSCEAQGHLFLDGLFVCTWLAWRM